MNGAKITKKSYKYILICVKCCNIIRIVNVRLYFQEMIELKTWQKATFIIVLVVFIAASVTISFISMARPPFEYEYQTEVEELPGNEGWVLFGFNGNNSTKEVYIDYVRDEDGNNPDESKPVSAVGRFTMNTDEYVETIYIGKDVKYIDETSFFYCKMLKAIEVDDANEYYTSVNGVLFTKDMKKLIVYPVMKENESASYIIPEGVERVGICAFYKNVSLKSIIIPSTLKEIGDMAFFKCENIGLVTLPDGLEKIGNDAFSYCHGMKHVMFIPSSVKEIGSFAFYACSNLKEFYMGAESESDITFGDSWLPKNIKKVAVNIAPEEQYGMNRDQSLTRNKELIEEGGDK